MDIKIVNGLVLVPWTMRSTIRNWCHDNRIDIEYNGLDYDDVYDAWEIKNEKDLVRFLLKWS